MTNPVDRASMTVRETAARMTPVPVGRRFGEVLAQSGRVILESAITAAAYVPGGNLLTAAVRGASVSLLGATHGGAAGLGSTVESPSQAFSLGGGSSGTALGGSAGGGTALGGGSAAGPAAAAGSDPAAGGDDILSRGQEQSIRMLRLQEAISEENRRYTALSNVLHARHEMAKNAIGNIR